MVAAEEDKRSVVAVLLEHDAKVDLTDVVSACTCTYFFPIRM